MLQETALKFLPEAVEWLRRMVETNSFTANAPGVDRVGKLTAECFSSLGFEAEFVPSSFAEHGCHLFLRRPGSDGDGKKPILLVTHLDTVFPPEEEESNHFHWQESPEEGRIYGPGSIDIKGGTVLIWLTLKLIQQSAPEFFESVSWIIAANSSEEVMSHDFAVRTEQRCAGGAAAVLVFEGGLKDADGNWQMVTSRKGRAEYRISVNGRAAHAGSAHHEGLNAIVALSKMMPGVAALTDYGEQLTVNIGTIQGGTVLNRVPHEAVAELEMRAFSPEPLENAGKVLSSLQRSGGDTEAEVVVECLGKTPAWPTKTESVNLFSVWKRVGDSLGMNVIATRRGGLSDANYLHHLGPTLDGLGPSGANAHCSERADDGSKVPEFLDATTLVPKAILNALSIQEIWRSSN